MPQPERPRRVLAPLGVASIVALFVLAVATEIATAQGDDEAQCTKREVPLLQEPPPIKRPPPPLNAIFFNGDVTIGGELPNRQGYTITARIGDYWESTAVPVGVGSGCGSGRYAHLIVAPPMELDLIGNQIQFWLNGHVRSNEHDWYAPLPPFYGTWTFPILREADLEFPALPDGYQLEGPLPATGGASLDKPMLAVFLILGLLATISGLVAARRCRQETSLLHLRLRHLPRRLRQSHQTSRRRVRDRARRYDPIHRNLRRDRPASEWSIIPAE